MPTDSATKKRPWWQRGPLTALCLALLRTALAHTKPLVDSGLATEETRAALRAFATQFAILTGVLSIFFWLGTIPHKGPQPQAPPIAGIDSTRLASQIGSAQNGDPWNRLEGYKSASAVGFVLGISAVGFFHAPGAIVDGRVTPLELGIAALLFLTTLWATLSMATLPHLLRNDSHQRLRNVMARPDASGVSFYTLIIGAPMAGAELLPDSLAFFFSRIEAVIPQLRKRRRHA